VGRDFRVIVDDEVVLHKRILFESPKTHTYELTVGTSEVHFVVIERGSFQMGSRFRILVDGTPIDLEV
jgi:hypothetical protein